MKSRLIVLTLIILLAAFLRFYRLEGEMIFYFSAFLGTLTVLLSYFLVKELFKKNSINYQLSAISTFLLAISPWHLCLSRLFLQSTMEIFLITLGVWLLLRFIRSQKRRLCLPHSDCIVLGLLFLLLLVFSLIHRLQGEAVGPTNVGLAQPRMKNPPASVLGEALISGRLTFEQEPAELIVNYLSSFTPNSLFLKTRYQEEITETGLLYLAELPFLLMGLYSLFKNKPDSHWFLLGWFLMAPLFSSLNTEMPFIIRAANFLPLLQILISYGMVNFWQDIGKKKGKKLLFTVYCLLFMFNIFYFLHLYFIHWPLEKFNFAS